MFMSEEELAIEVAKVDSIEIDDCHGAKSGANKIL